MRFKGFDVSIIEVKCVDDVMLEEFKILKKLKSLIGKHKKGTKQHTLLMKQIQKVKFSLSNKCFKLYQIEVRQKTNYYYQAYTEYPTVQDIKDTLDTFKSKLRQKRDRHTITRYSNKNILGYTYRTLGGVFPEKNAILDLQNKTDQMARIQQPKAPAKEFTSNYIGIELELYCRLNRNNLLNLFVKAKLAGYIYVKDDGSLRPEEDMHPHEVTILCKQEDVKTIVPRIIDVLRSKECDAAVNNSCGMHIHIDVRNRDPYLVYARLVRSLPLLAKLVPKERSSNKYCRINETTKLGDFYRDGKVENGVAVGRDERYRAINPLSVQSHRTIEVRLHSGTLNKKKIINWVDICASIADTEFDNEIVIPENFYFSIKKDQALLEYMNERVSLFSKGAMMDTKVDHAMDVAAGF